MSGRRQFDVDEALDRAMRLFWERGYEQASLEMLCTATGLGRGSLYATFGSKDELFRRSLERYATRYGDQYFQALAAHQDDPTGAVAAMLDAVLDRIADPAVPDGCLIAQSVSQANTLATASRDRVRTLIGDQRRRVELVLSRTVPDLGQRKGLAVYVVGIVQSLAVLSRAGAGSDDLRAVARLARQTVADTIARTAAPGAPAVPQPSTPAELPGA